METERRSLKRPRLFPIFFGKLIRRASESLKRFTVPTRFRLIRYPKISAFLSPDYRGAFFFTAVRREEMTAAWRAAFDRERETILQADRVLDHVFDLLGSGETKLGDEIDWSRDFKTGYSWPSHRPITGKEIACLDKNADIKVPWELSRFQHASLIGKAYWLTGDERYAEEFVSQVLDWIEKNPWGRGPNWACAMDVAIRAANWILGYHFFEASDRFNEDARRAVVRSLWQHGWFIERNLERGRVTGNHYIADLAGLLCLGVFFSGCERGRYWRDFALRELFSEMRRQVLDDGVDYEKSIGYHRLALELVTYSFVLARLNGLAIPPETEERWEKMVDFVAACVKPDGTAPQIGDSDDGIFYKLATPVGSGSPFLDHRYLLSLGALIFGRKDLAALSGGYTEEAFWALGHESKEGFERLQDGAAAVQDSAAFRTAGIYVMRAPGHCAIVDAGDNGMAGLGAHAHNDALSFELYAFDKSFIVDPGTYLYTAALEWRNRFRSTAYHNTVCVDGEEINPIVERWLFALPDAGEVIIHRWEVGDGELVFEAAHDAYRRLKKPVVHRRAIRFDKRTEVWTIDDRFEGKGVHLFESRLHFAPGIEPARVPGEKGRFETVCEGARLRIEARSENEFEAEIEDGWYSPSYGRRVPIRALKYSWRGDPPCRFVITLSNADHDAREARVGPA